MNNKRRKELDHICGFALLTRHNINENTNKCNVISDLQYIVDRLKEIQLDEEYYMYSIPDNLQGGIRYNIAEEACDNMETAISYLIDTIEDPECTLQEIVHTLTLCIRYIGLAAM